MSYLFFLYSLPSLILLFIYYYYYIMGETMISLAMIYAENAIKKTTFECVIKSADQGIVLQKSFK